MNRAHCSFQFDIIYCKHTKVVKVSIALIYFSRHPTYIVKRLRELVQCFRVRVLIVLVDTTVPTATAADSAADEAEETPLQELNRLCFQYGVTLLLAWSNLEAARYLETFKAYEKKSTASIQEKTEVEFIPKVSKLLSSHVPGLNKTDALSLLHSFGNLQSLSKASQEELTLVPGIGEIKGQRLFRLFNTPFTADS